jgi:hypothetical protein
MRNVRRLEVPLGDRPEGERREMFVLGVYAIVGDERHGPRRG